MKHHLRCEWVRCHVNCPHWAPPASGCEDCDRFARIIDSCRRSMKFTTEGTVTFTFGRTVRQMAAHRFEVHGEAEEKAS
jgi:hypothetical protein